MVINFKKYHGKKILILGLGLNQGGVGVTRFLAKQGANIRVTDLKNKKSLRPSIDELKGFPNIEYVLGQHREPDADWADLIIKNPAIKPDNHFIKYAKNKGKQIETDMGLLLNFVKPNQIIGVTGTKGKSTTTALIYEVLKANQVNVILAGNIGKSPLDDLEKMTGDSLLVLELSSFQLEAFLKHRVSPKWAVITNIMPDHLNYYLSMDDYINAKKIIAEFQKESDWLFLKKGDQITNSANFLNSIKSQVVYFDSSDLPKGFTSKLLGNHNLLNISAAFSVGEAFNLDRQKVLQTLKKFPGVEFRMQLIKKWQGIKIINDTAATTPDAATASLHAIGRCILLAGGMDKNLSYDNFAKEIEKNTQEVYFLEGSATDKLLHLITKKELVKGVFNNLEEALKQIRNSSIKKNIILFSPGATSFNLFQNEFDRGRKFNQAVDRIFI